MIAQDVMSNSSFGANILFIWTPLPTGPDVPTCESMAADLATGGRIASDVEALKVGEDPACRWRLSSAKSTGVQALRLQGDHLFMVQCQRAIQGDDEADRTCKQVIASLGFPD
jgi:hypothetical protein